MWILISWLHQKLADLDFQFSIEGMVNVLKFRAVVACHKNLDKQADQDQTASEEAV